jgi:hypothetical protein
MEFKCGVLTYSFTLSQYFLIKNVSFTVHVPIDYREYTDSKKIELLFDFLV